MKDRRALEKRKNKGIKLLKIRLFSNNKTLGGIEQYVLNNNFKWDIKKLIGMHGTTPSMCSCPFCCGNPRRIRGQKNLTKQEIKAPTIKDWE